MNWLNQQQKKLRDGDFTEVAGGAEETVHRGGTLETKRAQSDTLLMDRWMYLQSSQETSDRTENTFNWRSVGLFV